MLEIVTGNIFYSHLEVITSPVNCKGTQGAGLALQFKNKFPEADRFYRAACNKKEIAIGRPVIWKNPDPEKHSVLFFPTKDDWRDASKFEYVERGLEGLLAMDLSDIEGVALPALGCGLGGLPWSEVRPYLEETLGSLETEFQVFSPE